MTNVYYISKEEKKTKKRHKTVENAAATHKRGTRPRVHTYVDGEETYDSPKIDWTTGNVTVYSNAQVALKVLIY